MKLSARFFNISYEELFNEPSKYTAKERLAPWIGNVHSFNKSESLPTRIAEEDATQEASRFLFTFIFQIEYKTSVELRN